LVIEDAGNTFGVAHMYNIMARMKGTVLANIVLMGTPEGAVRPRMKEGWERLPCTARLEDLAHRTDACGYLNGTIDVAHVGGRKREGGRR
jgi:hypothetical protein